MIFEQLQPVPPHPILGAAAIFQADSNADKVDLSIGIYKDEAGRTPVLRCVKSAEQWLIETQITKGYLTPDGNPEYNAAILALLFDPSHPASRDGRVRTLQTPGGSAALRIAADLVSQCRSDAAIWLPAPTWSNHRPTFESARLPVREYPYYDVAGNQLCFEAMLQSLRGARQGDVVLVQGCCHNPTGADLDEQQWRATADLLATRGAVPLVDLAYQGFAQGIEEDSAAVRLLAETVPEMLVASSCSKNFGLYRDRVGALTLVAGNRSQAQRAMGHLWPVILNSYSMPPDHGASVVAHILRAPDLRSQWLEELALMRIRIQSMRGRLADLLESKTRWNWNFIREQHGLFLSLALSASDLDRLRAKSHLYLASPGRINVAGLTDSNVERVANALSSLA